MRIGFDATAIPPNRAGAGVYIFQLVRALAEVDCNNEYFIYGKPDHLKELKISQPNFHLIEVSGLSLMRRLIWEQTGLPAEVRRRRLDLLHSPHYTMPIIKSGAQVVTFCDMIFYLYPEMHSRGRRTFFQAMMRWSARHADRLVAISDSTRDDVMRVLGVPSKAIVSVPLAASPEYRRLPVDVVETVCSNYGLTPKGFLLYVGVLEPRKNVPDLLRAYSCISADFPDVPLAVVGKKGWMYDEIFKLVTELNLQERVRFLGYVPEDQLIALYNGTRAFIYPSRYEGFGLPVLEALQCGAPVITTNVSSMPEVAGDAALLVAPGDIEGLAMALRRLLTDEDLTRELSDRGLDRSTHFSWQRCADETLDVYRSLARPNTTKG